MLRLDVPPLRISATVRAQTIAAFMGTLLAGGLVSIVLLLSANHHEGVTNCNQIELLKSAIRRTIAVGDAKVGLQGQPGYDYYRAHPGELLKAHQLNQQALLTFKPTSCG